MVMGPFGPNLGNLPRPKKQQVNSAQGRVQGLNCVLRCRVVKGGFNVSI